MRAALPSDIELTDVAMQFGSDRGVVAALAGIQMSVPRGSLITIVGPSGCGKTTLLKIIGGLIEPTVGTVRVDAERRQRGLAYVPQLSVLLPWRTVRQNASIGVEIRSDGKSNTALSRAKVDYVDSLLKQWHLDGFEDSYPNQLSGGMEQRVAIIRALASQPRILLCDEPFSAIDFVTRLQLSTMFKKSCKVEGTTTVLVTHNIEEAIFLGDEVLVMSGRPGRIVSRYRPRFSVGGHDAVACRQSPEFPAFFKDIWRDLETHRV